MKILTNVTWYLSMNLDS